MPRKPWVYGGRDSHPACRYSCLHSHLPGLHRRFPAGFKARATLPYHAGRPKAPRIQSFGRPLKLPIIFGAESLDESAITHCLNGGCL